MVRALCLCLSLLSLSFIARETHAANQEVQVWAAAFFDGDLLESEGVVYWLDLQARRGESGALAIVRPGIGYRLFDGLIAHLGYAWIPRLPDQAEAEHEHRIWQQLFFTQPLLPSLALTLRGRFEQRFFRGDGALGLRARGFARIGWTIPGSPIALVAWDEAFVALNQAVPGQVSGFDQNRLFAGLALFGGQAMRVELGYLNVYLDRADDVINHNFSLTVFARL
jgi:hypothetical protein